MKPSMPSRSWAFALLSLLVVGGCTDEASVPSDPVIIASFDALGHIVEPLAGDIPVHSLLPSGVSPHAYSPRPSEVARLHQASLVVFAHANIDGWISDLTSRPDLALFGEIRVAADAHSEGQTLSDDDGHSAEEAHSFADSHASGDPHVWNDPVLVGHAIPNLTQTLCRTFQDRCPAIRRRANVFSASLIALEDSLRNAAAVWQADHPDACFVTAQPFVDRFLERFGFRFVGPLSISPDVEPSPSSLSALLKEAEQQSCTTIVVQEALENRLERRLALDRGWTVVAVDPLGGSASSYADYLDGLLLALTSSTDASVPANSNP